MTLPELHTGELDAATLAALLDDLGRFAELHDVRVKGGATRYAAEAPVSLGEAAALLARADVRGVQVRYRWDGAEWTDTILRAQAGARVVRMRLPDLG